MFNTPLPVAKARERILRMEEELECSRALLRAKEREMHEKRAVHEEAVTHIKEWYNREWVAIQNSKWQMRFKARPEQTPRPSPCGAHS